MYNLYSIRWSYKFVCRIHTIDPSIVRYMRALDAPLLPDLH